MKQTSFRRRICATFVALLTAAACVVVWRGPSSDACAQERSKADKATAQTTWTPRLVATFEGYGGPREIFARGALVAFSPDGRLLALSDPKGHVKLYDAATGRPLYTLTTHKDWINGFSFGPDSRTAATRDAWDRMVRLWDLSDGKELRSLKGRDKDFETMMKSPNLPAEEFFNVPISPDGRAVLSERKDDIVAVFDTATGEERAALDHKTESNTAKAVLKYVFRGKERELHMQAAYSGDGRRIVTANGDDLPKLWDAETYRLVAALAGGEGRIYNAAFSPDSRTVATEMWRGTVMLWDASTGRLKSALRAEEIDYSYFNNDKVYGSPSFAFSPDSRYVVTFRDRATQLWDAASGSLVQTLGKHGSRSVAFSPDSRVLAAAGEGGTSARLWDVASGRLLRELPRAEKATRHVAFSPDGRTLLTASDAGLMLWDAESGELLATLDRARFPARFSPDGRMLAAGGTGETALLYELPSR